MTAEQKRKWRGTALVSTVALGALGFGAYAAVTNEPEAAVEDTARGQMVTVARAEIAPFARHVPLSGEARPRKDIRVFAPAQGVRVLELLVEQGDFVRQGQPLARLDTALFQGGKIGDGKIFVSDISKIVRIRTGETDIEAI